MAPHCPSRMTPILPFEKKKTIFWLFASPSLCLSHRHTCTSSPFITLSLLFFNFFVFSSSQFWLLQVATQHFLPRGYHFFSSCEEYFLEHHLGTMPGLWLQQLLTMRKRVDTVLDHFSRIWGKFGCFDSVPGFLGFDICNVGLSFRLPNPTLKLCKALINKSGVKKQQ